jgi:hypothetical protein
MPSRADTGEAWLRLDSLRLEPGAHDSPHDGVCIVELASVIAREPFSDRPDCVCPVIAAFLRSWNDRSSHAQRQRLIPYAERIVGSRAGRRVTRRRRDVCLTWAGADLTGNRLSRLAWRIAMRARILVLCGLGAAVRLDEGAGELAARTAFARHGPETALPLVETLIGIGSERDSVSGFAHGPGDGNGNGSGRIGDAELVPALIERAIRPDARPRPRKPAGVA